MFIVVEALTPGVWAQVHNYTYTLIGKVKKVEVGDERTKLHMEHFEIDDFWPDDGAYLRDYMNGTPLIVGDTLEEVRSHISKFRMQDLVKRLGSDGMVDKVNQETAREREGSRSQGIGKICAASGR